MRTVASLALLALAATTAHAAPRQHDGFYFRFGAGGGYASGHLAGPSSSASRGGNVATELAAGWALRPGLVLGAGTFPAVVMGPKYDAVDAGGQHVSGTGPFLLYYLDPSGGLHLQAGLLFAAGYLDGGQREGKVGFGWGATAGLGHASFVSDEWSLGALARFTVYQLHGVEDRLRLLSPALLLTATFN